jgi:hypothetical protein
MNKTLEVVLTVLALAGMYCAMPKSASPSGSAVVSAQQAVLLADGSDPMPLCRGRRCKPTR